MSEIKGIYAASVSIFNKNLTLNVEKTINHAENLIKRMSWGGDFGSNGQVQLITEEKIQLINKLIESS